MTDEIKSVSDSLSDVYDEIHSSTDSAIENTKTESTQAEVDQTTEIEKEQGEIEQINEQEENPAQDIQEDVRFPTSLSNRDKELLKTAPVEIQQIIAKRTAEVDRYLHQKTQEISQKERGYRELDEVLEPYKPDLNMRGISTGQLVRSLIGLQENLDRDPARTINALLQNYGLTPEALAQQYEPIDPKLQIYEKKINDLESSLSRFEQQRIQEQVAYNESDVASFVNSADQTGKPLYPHYDKVQTTMLPLVAQLRTQYPTADNQSILKHAYEQACWLDPDVRMQLVREHAKVEASKQLQTKAQNAQKAKSASISISGNPDGGTSQINKQSKGRVSDDVTDVYDELFG